MRVSLDAVLTQEIDVVGGRLAEGVRVGYGDGEDGHF